MKGKTHVNFFLVFFSDRKSKVNSLWVFASERVQKMYWTLGVQSAIKLDALGNRERLSNKYMNICFQHDNPVRLGVL